eukprot:scaffold2879_cov269-Prasinococcus_capsulatus_cf.AAC.6
MIPSSLPPSAWCESSGPNGRERPRSRQAPTTPPAVVVGGVATPTASYAPAAGAVYVWPRASAAWGLLGHLRTRRQLTAAQPPRRLNAAAERL